tara:strand:+ start:2724 stop:3626 length:903 start_codon:yes stop_codon:yes gene_type:complete
MATINLGRVKPVFRGAYAGGTAYVVDDIVTSGNETFICIQASTGNATSNASYWTKLAAKGTDGTNGTDVGTVITTQGDILYRDGSGLQRLPKGTAGQVLKMNSSANAPEYGTLSSDWVKLHTVNHSGSNVTNYAFDGYFDDSVYGSYKYIGYHRMASGQSSSSAHGIVRVNINGSESTDNQYNFAWQSGYYNGSAGDQNRGNANTNIVRVFNTWQENQVQDTTCVFEFTLVEPQSTSIHSTVFWSSHMSWVSNEIASGLGAMNNENSNVSASTKITGLTFRYENGQNFNLAYGTLYGLKK